MQYFDKHGNEIVAGMSLRMEDGSIEKVYATDNYGEPDLGINASNEAYLKHHPEQEREYYSLSNYNLREIEITEPTHGKSLESLICDATAKSKEINAGTGVKDNVEFGKE